MELATDIGLNLVMELATDIGLNQWDSYVFESGTFTNDQDLGYNNWTWSGNSKRSEDDKPKKDGRTVTFEPIGAAISQP